LLPSSLCLAKILSVFNSKLSVTTQLEQLRQQRNLQRVATWHILRTQL
jgi:hypothetical protein